MFRKALLVVALATSAAAPASAANLLVNGSFEDGFNGWELSGTLADFPPVVIPYNSNAGYPDGAFNEPIPQDSGTSNPNLDDAGEFAAYFVSDNADPQTLSQEVTLFANVLYTFGFDIYKPANGDANANGATFSASLGDVEFASFSADDLPVTTWTHFFATTTFLAPSSGEFQFNFTSNGFPAKDFVIDRVYLGQIAVPEPTTWAMLIAGFGMIGGAMRRRRTTFVTA